MNKQEVYRKALLKIMHIVLASRTRDPAAIKVMQIAQDALTEMK